MYTEQELEGSLRRAFVDHKADYIILEDRRNRFLGESINLGIAKGWLSGLLNQYEEQSSCIECRLTPEGRKHFGLA